MRHLPISGVITFLFTDIAGSTQLWENAPEAMQAALEKHDALLIRVIRAFNGHVFKTGGDGFYAAFASPLEALRAAIALQRALQQESWGQTPIRVRMGLHSGEAQARDGDYFGPTLNRVARLMSAGHGGQVLLSQTTRELVYYRLPPDISLKDLGEKRLKDLSYPERIFQAQASDLAADFPPLRTLDSFRHNLPEPRTSFIGGQEVLAGARRLLKEHRLLTLTGPGGIGKTRLSIQVAAESLERFEDGVWFVEMAPLLDSTSVAKTVLKTIGLREEAARTAQQVLTDFLAAKSSLLILDNCEHLVEACATLADDLLRTCPGLTLLASSREPLGVVGESVYQVPTLSAPGQGNNLTAEALTDYDAVQLFVERARAVLPEFQLTDENAAAVAKVTGRLDGIPLAIELAAARVNLLQVEGIAARLDDAFGFLKSTQRQSLPHHQTLRTLIDWSFDLLSGSEITLLNRLSVFVGSWTLEAAEQVCAGNGIKAAAVLDLLEQLVRKSLVQFTREQGNAARYHLLETIRQYTLETLEASGETGWMERKHLAYFLQLASKAEPQLHEAGQERWFQLLENEHDNMLAALERSGREAAEAESGLSLAGHLGWFWYAQGYLHEGRELLDKLLEKSAGVQPLTIARAKWSQGLLNAILGNLEQAFQSAKQSLETYQAENDTKGLIESRILLGVIAYFQRSDPEKTRVWLEEAIDLAAGIDYQWAIGEGQHMLGHIAALEKRFDESRRFFTASVSTFRKAGDTFSLVHPINDLGRMARNNGDLETASKLFKESLAISKKHHYRWGLALTHSDLGKIAFTLGKLDEALGYLQESLQISRDLGDKLRIIECLAFLAFVWQALGETEKFGLLLGAGESLRDSIGNPRSSTEQAEYDRMLQATGLDPTSLQFKSIWDSGQRMAISDAIELALEKHVRETT